MEYKDQKIYVLGRTDTWYQHSGNGYEKPVSRYTSVKKVTEQYPEKPEKS